MRRPCAPALVPSSLAALVLALVARPMGARAEGAPPPAAPVADDALGRAKDLFKSGLALLDAGDYEAALDRFQRSRALVPGKGNTVNLAVCLDHLGRYDEALEAYEDVLGRFADQLAPEDRASIGPAMAALRAKIGSLELSANVAGSVVIDARDRGKLPRTTPLRLLAGPHLVRVLEDGYATCEKRVEIRAGEKESLDCQLAPLVRAGQLRLDDPTSPGASVFVDRALVGTTPWEGTLSPGPHLVWIEKDGLGTAPSRAFVVEGQTALVRLSSKPLGPEAQIDVEPRAAELSIDDVPLGAPTWRGPLPAGAHRVSAAEPGYFTRTVALDEPPSGASPPKLAVRLEIDPSDPRWPKRSVGAPIVGAFGGPAVGGGLGGDAESRCPAACGGAPTSRGFLLGARAGFRFPFGLSLELDGGYLRAETRLSRTVAASFGPRGAYPVTYQLSDDIEVRGPFVGGGVSARLPAGTVVGAMARTTVAAWITGSTDPITGAAAAGGTSAPVGVSGADDRPTAVGLLVMPELGLDVKLGPFALGASLAIAFVPTPGPSFTHAQIEVTPSCTMAAPGAAGCASSSAAVQGERAYGRFYLFVPQVAATYAF